LYIKIINSVDTTAIPAVVTFNAAPMPTPPSAKQQVGGLHRA